MTLSLALMECRSPWGSRHTSLNQYGWAHPARTSNLQTLVSFSQTLAPLSRPPTSQKLSAMLPLWFAHQKHGLNQPPHLTPPTSGLWDVPSGICLPGDLHLTTSLVLRMKQSSNKSMRWGLCLPVGGTSGNHAKNTLQKRAHGKGRTARDLWSSVSRAAYKRCAAKLAGQSLA